MKFFKLISFIEIVIFLILILYKKCAFFGGNSLKSTLSSANNIGAEKADDKSCP